MIFLEPIADLNSKDNQKNMAIFKQHHSSGKQCFLFLYMDGCGPCNMTKESWKDINKHIKKHNLSNNNVIVAEINKDLFGEMENIGAEPMGFPTLRYINNRGGIVEEYESSRTPEAFAQWIESKIPRQNVSRRHRHLYHKKTKGGSRRTKRVMRGGKWSMKYKKSINCKRPKGFSQKQHCKYGRKGWKTRKNR
jgi:hypothetical protein